MANKLYLIEEDKNAASRASAVWQAACQSLGLELEVLSLTSATTRTLCERLALHSFPALLQGDRILAVGIPDPGAARQILSRLVTD